jgi:hypothetical protein
VAIAPVGLLVLRAWLEAGSERPLRVEVRLTADSGQGFERELMCSEPAEVEATKQHTTPASAAAAFGRPIRLVAALPRPAPARIAFPAIASPDLRGAALCR